MRDEMPEPIARWIESETGGRLVAAKRAGEGASRRAFAVDLVGEHGPEALFCLCDATPAGGGSLRDAAVLRALAPTAIPVPAVRAASAELGAILLERVPGRSALPPADAEPERERVARDLMRLSALLHRLDPAVLPIAHLGAPGTPRSHALDQLARLDALLTALGNDALELQRFAAAALRRSPPTAERTSLVHSDMGPGNFLYEDGAVTAILDWEVAHWGDPMEDLAAIAVRDIATPIGPLAVRHAEYAAAGGPRIDAGAIAWYRVFILARNTALIALGLRHPLAPADREPLECFQLLLLRALALCLDELGGVFDRADRDRIAGFVRERESLARAEAGRLGELAERRPQRLVVS